MGTPRRPGRGGAGLRRRTKVAAANALHATGLLGASLRMKGARAPDSVCILGLHRVLDPEQSAQAHSHPAIVMRERTFERLLDHLTERFEILSTDDFLARRFGSSPRPKCLVTFDDGWADNHATAFPHLRRKGVPALILLATGYIGTGRTFWVEQLIAASKKRDALSGVRQALRRSSQPAPEDLFELIEVLKRMPNAKRNALLGGVGQGSAAGDAMLSWEQVTEMHRAGIAFGGHTVTHPLLTQEGGQTVRTELAGCKAELEKRLGGGAVPFAYPNGDWNPQVGAAVRAAGFACGFTTERGWYKPGGDEFAIKRVLLHEASVTGTSGEFSPAMFEMALAR